MTGGSFVGASAPGSGSYIYPSSGPGTSFTDLFLTVQSQANALVAPSDTPTVDSTRLVQDATPNRVLWTYTTTGGWKGVQVA
jgi:hypothetical protein